MCEQAKEFETIGVIILDEWWLPGLPVHLQTRERRPTALRRYCTEEANLKSELVCIRSVLHQRS